MKKIWTLASFEWKRVFIKPQSYLLMFALPLLFTFIFGSLFQSGAANLPKLAIVDEDNSNLSRSLIKVLQSNEVMELIPMADDKANIEFGDNKLTGMIRIKQGYEQMLLTDTEPTIHFEYTPSFNEAMTIQHMINNEVTIQRIKVAASTTWSEINEQPWEQMYTSLSNGISNTPIFSEQLMITRDTEENSMDNVSSRSAGFAIMFVMIIIMSVTGALLDARKTGVWSRLLSTPITKMQLISGYLVSFFLIGWMQFGILMLLSNWLFGVYWGNLAATAVLVTSLLLCVVGLALLIGSFAKTSEQQSVYGNVVIISTCMLAGVYWPLEIVPQFMQEIADFVPQTWAMKGFNEIIAGGASITDISLPVFVLLGFAVLFLSVGTMRLKFE